MSIPPITNFQQICLNLDKGENNSKFVGAPIQEYQ